MVALRKESVDRNSRLCGVQLQQQQSLSARRAWIEILCSVGFCLGAKSLSARRAWIEMVSLFLPVSGALVALRKESVDRNSIGVANFRASTTSLSARRAWIEIRTARRYTGRLCVALRKESVDRNHCFQPHALSVLSRSPQGERG